MLEGFIKIALNLQEVQSKAIPLQAAASGSLENARGFDDLYNDPETMQFSPTRTAESLASTLTTAPGISGWLDQAVSDPRTANILIQLKDNPAIRAKLMETGGILPVVNEMEDRLNRRIMEQQRALVKGQIQDSSIRVRNVADDAAASAEAVQEFQRQFEERSRYAKDKVDPRQISRLVSQKLGPGTRSRLKDMEESVNETMSKPGLNIVHKNLNLAKRKEVSRKLNENLLSQHKRAADHYQAFSDLGELYNQADTLPGPAQVNKTQRVNLSKAKDIYDAATQSMEAAKQAAYNALSLLEGTKDMVGHNKRTVTHFRRNFDERGGMHKALKDKVDEYFESVMKYRDQQSNKLGTSERKPLASLIQELKNV